LIYWERFWDNIQRTGKKDVFIEAEEYYVYATAFINDYLQGFISSSVALDIETIIKSKNSNSRK
jgi:hypothetical protein